MAVTYCSEKHQLEDWSFHKPTCNALKKIKRAISLPKKLDQKSFYQYRTNLLRCLIELRKFPDSSYLTPYEQQIVMLPWVCPICFVAPECKYECGLCQSVVYCSIEHMKEHYDIHKDNCDNWAVILRLYIVREFTHKSTVKKVPKYRNIGRRIATWPHSRFQLSNVIQSEIMATSNMKKEDFTALEQFLEPLLPAAVILYTLEQTVFLRNRKLHRKNKRPVSSMKTLTVHFAVADDCELSLQWDKMTQLLLDWIRNIDKVQIIVTSSKLRQFVVPAHLNEKKFVVKIYQEDYHNCRNLPEPDVIILLECSRAPFIDRIENTWNEKYINSLAKYQNIPVIFSSGRHEILTQILTLYHEHPTAICAMSPVMANRFGQSKKIRLWEEEMGTFIQNEFLLFMVIMKNSK